VGWLISFTNAEALFTPSPMFTSTVSPFLISLLARALKKPAKQTAEAGPMRTLVSNAVSLA